VSIEGAGHDLSGGRRRSPAVAMIADRVVRAFLDWAAA
jgi:hypothetical protein